MRRRSLLLVLAAAALAPLSLPHAESAPKPRRVLLITGENNHNWRETSPHLDQFLEATGRFTVDVTDAPATFLADRDRMWQYDVYLLNYNGKRWGPDADANFLEAVRSGKGVSVIHAANNAFSGWAEYDKIIGIGWRAGAGHGAYHEFPVKFVVKDHPITKGLPDMTQHPDELYHRLAVTPGEEMTILATAFADPAKGGTGKDEPMALVKTYGRGRVFHTPMGHDLRAMQDPAFMLLVARGTEWAATGKVTIKRLPRASSAR